MEGGCETTLCHASYDTLYGPNQKNSKFLLNFKAWTYDLHSTLYIKLYAAFMTKDCFFLIGHLRPIVCKWMNSCMQNKLTNYVKNYNIYSKVQNCLQSYTIYGHFHFAFHL
jgi:hypothetical protein